MVVVPAQQASAAVIQQVQSGTAVSSTNGITTVTISSVDPTKSVLIFQARSNSNRPGGTLVRGRLASATTIEFERVYDDTPLVDVNIQWYIATFGSGVFVQRGETTQSGTTTNVAIASVTSLAQAFVLYSKTPVAVDNSWGSDDPILGEITTTTQVTFRANAANVGDIISWQVVQFTNAADINVQKGSITTMTGATTTVTATLSPAVNVNKTFVLVGIRTTDGITTDIGARMVRAVLTNSTTITFDRAVAGSSDVTEIEWQAVELKDASIVWRGNASFAIGASLSTVNVGAPQINLDRAVGFLSGQGGAGQSMGRTSYVGDDIVGVGTATAIMSVSQIALTRDSTVGAADFGWFVVQFDGGSGLKVGSFTKTATPGPTTQVIAHGLGQVPKAVILWTEGRPDETFASAAGITSHGATSATTTGGGGVVVQDVLPSAAFGDNAAATTTITTATFSTTQPNELLLAFIGFGGAAGSTVTGVTGAGLTWELVQRANTQNGPAEIWRTFAPATLTNVAATATLSVAADASISVMSFSATDPSGLNGSGAIGATGTGNANPGAPTASLTTTRTNSAIVGIGTDVDHATARTVGATQFVLHEFSPAGPADDFYMQVRTSVVPVAGTLVSLNDTAPTTDRYNMVICEILPALNNTLSINVPAGTLPNDVMIASIGVSQATAATITAPAGWTLAPAGRMSIGTGTPNALAVYYKIADAVEPAAYSWTFSATTGAAGGIQSFANVDVTNPIDVDAGLTHASSTSSVAPSVTTTMANDMLVRSHTYASSGTRTITGAGTEAYDVASLAPQNAAGQSMEMNYLLQAAVGASGTSTTTASGNADTGVAHTLALRPASPAYFGFGMTDGTTSKSISASSEHGADTSNAATQLADKALTIVKWDTATNGIVLAEADLQSWDSTNLTLNWTTNDDSAQYVIHYIAIGGTSVTAAVVPWTTGTVTNAAKGITGVGFRPSVVLHANASYLETAASPATSAFAAFGLGAMDGDGHQWASGFYTLDNAGTSDTQRGQKTGTAPLTGSFLYSFGNALTVQKQASFVSMDADGFTVNVSNATSANNMQVISLALGGLNAQVGSWNKSTGAAPATDKVTGINFQPSAVLMASVQDLTQAGNATAHSRFGIGASDGVTEGSSAFTDTDALAVTSMFAIDKTSKAFVKLNTNAATIGAEADLTSMNTDGFSLKWTTNDGIATEMLYLAMAPIATTQVNLISFTGEKYSRGVLLQWKTGYEIDNLGFNVYRDIGGVRTKLNASLITGSGLQAGQGVGVNSALSYARWDLDAAAGDPTVTYWLEDVDFNGKSTMHLVTFVTSQLTEPVTPDSGELSDLSLATNAKQIFFASNPDQVSAGARVAPQVPPAVTQQWALAGQATVKLGIQKQGWYRVTRDDLVAGGLPTQVDPSTLQLFVNGAEQAMRVTTATNGIFTSGDTIEFYGAGTDTPYTDTRTYWLQAGVQPGRRIAVAPTASLVATTATGFASALQRKDRSIYAAAILNGDAENWFGLTVGDSDNPGVATTLTLAADHIDQTVGGSAQITISLQGVTSVGHRVGVLVNNFAVGEIDFSGQTYAVQSFPVALGVLVEGQNTVTLTALGGDADSSLTDTITLTYPHSYQADADRLKFTVAGPASMTVGGFAGSSIRVFDVTDRTAPIELPVTSAGPSSVTATVPGAGLRTLLAFSDETVSSPVFVQANQPSHLHAAANAADYVIVSHADFLTQVAPLAALRQQQGHTTAVVDIADVYDEFSFGEKTPQALRDFLQWSASSWATTPKFVVLAGDATIDPRDYAGFGNADFVPTKQVTMTEVALETASDDWFVDFQDNGLPQVAIGRLSVRSGAQAQGVVAKIIGYDSVGPQAWTKDVLLVADKNDSTANFEQASDALSTLVPSNYRVHTDYRGTLGDAPARQALTDAVNSGQLIVNYSGHGSTQVWTDVDLLTNSDVPAWTNATRLPLVVAMNCLNGLFNGIYGEDSLAEALQRAPNGGAVAVWASSSATGETTQSAVDQELFRLIFNGTYATVGEAVAVAKRVVANQDLRRSWIFFGDPAMRLNGAPVAATTSTLGAPPVIITQPHGTSIPSGQRAALSVAAVGMAPLTYQWYAQTSRSTMSLIPGATSNTYTSAVQNETISYMVRVSSPSGTTDSAVAVVATPPTITTASAWPAASARVGYALALTASDGALPYQWSATGLPSGLQLDAATGEVFNAPNAAGTFTFDVAVTGADGVAAHKIFTLTVNTATDVLLNQQWHLQDRALEVASANVVPAWTVSRGAGVVIGIVDDGVQGTHPDLQANYRAGLSYDFQDHDVDASPATSGACGVTANCQGTQVAGIAAARGDNGYGGSGVAPLAGIAGIRLAPDATDAEEAAAFSLLWDTVAVENESWHRADDGQSLSAPGPLADVALTSAIAQGRAGLGRIFVWAAGDGRAVGDNCNFDGYANSRFGIAVGAVDDTGHQAPYSEPCAALFVTAPSSGVPGVNRSLTTTDLVGVDGADPTDDTDSFGGTAGAAPIVSGVAALMLARNPALTWRDVQHLLVRSSRAVDTNDPSWTTGPFPHSEKYGFGIVDALAAVTRAATWRNVAAESAVLPVTHTVNLSIPDNTAAGVSNVIQISSAAAGFTVEHVEVEFTATHPHRGDLEVTLTSPAGVVSHLATARPADAGADFTAWRFRSVRHWGEAAVGAWTLTVTDRAAGNTGTFTGWTLRLFGTASNSGGGGGSSATPVTVTAPAPTTTPAPVVTSATPTTGSVVTPSAPSAPISTTGSTTVTPSTTTTAPSTSAAPAVTAAPASALGSSLAPARPATSVPTPTASPVDATAPATDPTAVGLAASFGAYGGAPVPVSSIPASDRPAGSPAEPGSPTEPEATTPATPTPKDAPAPKETPAPKPEPDAAPGTPLDLVASVNGSTIVLKWGAPATGPRPTSYILEAGSASGKSNLFVSPTGSGAVSFTAKNAEAGTYFVRVRAANTHGTSEPSNEAMVVVGGKDGKDAAACTAPPTAPGGLQFAVTGSTVVVSWEASKSGPASYIVEMGSGPGGGNSLVVSGTRGAETTLTEKNVASGTYFIRVRARNACGDSASSDKLTVAVR